MFLLLWETSFPADRYTNVCSGQITCTKKNKKIEVFFSYKRPAAAVKKDRYRAFDYDLGYNQPECETLFHIMKHGKRE